jgi:hypothetical protein
MSGFPTQNGAAPVTRAADDPARVIEVLQQLQRGMRIPPNPEHRGLIDVAIWAVRTVRACTEERERLRLVVDEIAAYSQLAGEADQLLARARAEANTDPAKSRRTRHEALVKATLAQAAATAAAVQQGREMLEAGRADRDQLLAVMREAL